MILYYFEQLIDSGYREFFSPLQLFENFHVEKYDYKISKTYMKKKIENAIKINKLYFDETKTYIRSSRYCNHHEMFYEL